MAQVVFVDDEALSVEPFRQAGLDVAIRAPDDVSPEILQDARVVMVDWNLGEIGNDSPMKPKDGFDVAALFGTWAALHQADRCAAFCLYSGRLEVMKGGYPPGLYREHALARTRGVEWVFDRPTNAEHFGKIAAQLVELLDGVGEIDKLLAEKVVQTSNILQRILGRAELSDQLLSDIEETRPPTHESMRATNGRTLLRWLLHRILPYPTFLIDEYQLAALCRLSLADFRQGVQDSPALQAFYVAGRYGGILSEFIGPRWWADQANQYLWEVTKGKSFDPATLREALKITNIGDEEMVLCIDGNYRWEEELSRIDAAVRVAPEDWPPFARPAWMRIDRIRDEPGLAEFVDPLDRDAINA